MSETIRRLWLGRPRCLDRLRAGDASAIVVSGLISLAGLEQDASIVGGFIPVLASGATLPPDIGFVLPYWLTPLSATLIHAGFIHLALNLVMLVYCGQQTERAVGTRGIVILYLIGAYAAALGQWAQDPGSTRADDRRERRDLGGRSGPMRCCSARAAPGRSGRSRRGSCMSCGWRRPGSESS